MRQIFSVLCIILAFGSVGQSYAQQAPAVHHAEKEAKAAQKQLLIPNAFTPNNDGRNDYFKILNFSNQQLLEFKVFNRWGTIMFKTTDPKAGWDGTFKNQKQPIGVYGYMIRIAYPEGVVETYKGTVTLLR